MAAREKQAALARKNLDKRFEPIRSAQLARPVGGWIRAIRDALGMTTRQLAQRMQVAQSRVVALEQAERHGATTLKSLREAAEALNCRLVYALVPNKPLEELVRDRAREKAFRQQWSVGQSMLLENHSLTPKQANEELERLTEDILAEPINFLWEDE